MQHKDLLFVFASVFFFMDREVGKRIIHFQNEFPISFVSKSFKVPRRLPERLQHGSLDSGCLFTEALNESRNNEADKRQKG